MYSAKQGNYPARTFTYIDDSYRGEKKRPLPLAKVPDYQSPYNHGVYYGPRPPYSPPPPMTRYPLFMHSTRPRHRDDYSSYSEDSRDERRGSTQRMIIIVVILALIVIGLVLGSVAIWLALRGDDSPSVSYEVKIELMTRVWVENMGNPDTDTFRTTQDEFCTAFRNVFSGAVLLCSVDQFTEGSVISAATIRFDKNKLDDIARDYGLVPSGQELSHEMVRESISKGIADTNEKLFAGAKVISVLPERDIVYYNVDIELANMTWHNDLLDPKSVLFKEKEAEYCNAMRAIYGDAMSTCRVSQFINNSVLVKGNVNFFLRKLKQIAHSSKSNSDASSLTKHVKDSLDSSQISYLATNGFDKASSVSLDASASDDGKIDSGTTTTTKTTMKTTLSEMTTSTAADTTSTTVSTSASGAAVATSASAAVNASVGASEAATPETTSTVSAASTAAGEVGQGATGAANVTDAATGTVAVTENPTTAAATAEPVTGAATNGTATDGDAVTTPETETTTA